MERARNGLARITGFQLRLAAIAVITTKSISNRDGIIKNYMSYLVNGQMTWDKMNDIRRSKRSTEALHTEVNAFFIGTDLVGVQISIKDFKFSRKLRSNSSQY